MEIGAAGWCSRVESCNTTCDFSTAPLSTLTQGPAWKSSITDIQSNARNLKCRSRLQRKSADSAKTHVRVGVWPSFMAQFETICWEVCLCFDTGPEIITSHGLCENGRRNIAFTCLLWVNKPQINYPISRNPWEVIILGPVNSKPKTKSL